MAQEDPIRFFRVVVGTDVSIFRDSGPGIPNFPVKVDDLQLRNIRVLATMLREGRLTNQEEYQALGANLYEILFHNDLGTAIADTYKDASNEYVRVELEFQKGREELSSFPWELLYCPPECGSEGFLADRPKLILTRRLDLKGPDLCIERPPLKILFVASGPTGHKVEYESVLESIEGLSGGMVDVRPLLPGERSKTDKNPVTLATWENFETLVGVYKPDAIHFLGHGRWDDKRKAGTILFMGVDNKEDPRSESELAAILSGSSVRLIFLQACESAQSDPYHAFSGAAQKLAQQGIPAVVGMQSKISHSLANLFAREFYEALAKRLTVDAALQMARRKLRSAPSDPDQRLGFVIPVLYLRESGSLFPPAAPTGKHAGPSISAARPTTGQEPESTTCAWCGERNEPDDFFCAKCEAALFCSNCKNPVDRKRPSCGRCGTPLRQPSPADEFAQKPSGIRI